MGVALGLIKLRPYRIYSVLLNQTLDNAPTATTLENDIGNIVWSYADTGRYIATLTGAFPETKTFLYIQDLSAVDNKRATTFRINNDTIEIQTTETSGAQLDGQLINNAFEIRVYD